MTIQSGNPGQQPARTASDFSPNSGSSAGSGLNGGDINSGTGTQRPSGGIFDFANGLSALPVSSLNGGQAIRDAVKVWDEMDKKDGTGWGIDMLVLDNTRELGWRYGAIIPVVFAANKPNRIAVYPMILEITESSPLDSYTTRIGELEFPVKQVPSMAMDDQFIERVRNLVMDHFSQVADVTLQLLPGMVVPRDVELTKADNVKVLIENAARACVTALAESLPNFVDADLSKLQGGSVQVMKVESNSQPRYDIVGMPIRSDISLTFLDRNNARAKEANNNNNQNQRRSLNDTSAVETVWAQMGGFIDLSFTPPAVNPLYNQADPMAAYRNFTPRFVIDSLDHRQLATTASSAMMFALTTCLAQPALWHGLLYQRMKNFNATANNQGRGGEFDPTDIGVLNVVAGAIKDAKGAHGPWELKGNDSRPEDFVSFAQKVLVPNIHVAIDVAHAGPQSWFLGILTAMANGNQDAMRLFVAKLDKLTGGLFSTRFFNGGVPQQFNPAMFFSECNNTIHAGYGWSKGPGGEPVKVDLRQVDYLYVLNKFKGDPDIVKKWSQSFLVGEIDVAIRLANRAEVLDACFANPVYTGYYERHTFRSDLLITLFSCMLQLNVRPELKFVDPLQGANAGVNAPAFVTSSAGLNAASLATGFQTGTTGGGGGFGTGGLGAGGLGRWN